MKSFILFAATFLFVSSPVFAGPQQEKMKACNAQAKGMKGEERKVFMKTCLSNKSAPDAAAASDSSAAKVAVDAPAPKSSDPKQRMKDCNAQAKGKKGDERKAFMSDCLKNAGKNDVKAN